MTANNPQWIEAASYTCALGHGGVAYELFASGTKCGEIADCSGFGLWVGHMNMDGAVTMLSAGGIDGECVPRQFGAPNNRPFCVGN